MMGMLIEPGGVEFLEVCERTLRRLPFMESQLGGFKCDPERGLDDAQRELLLENADAVRFEFLD